MVVVNEWDEQPWQFERRPASAEGMALCDAASALVLAKNSESRERQRSAKQQAVLRDTVGRMVGGLLFNWRPGGGGLPHTSARSMKRDAFTGEPVAFRQFEAAWTAMHSAGLIGHQKGIRYQVGPGWWAGKAGLFWPMQPLLDMAVAHDVNPGGFRQHFKPDFRTVPVKVMEPLRLSLIRPSGNVLMPIPPDDAQAAAFSAEVEAMNAAAAAHTYEGCDPPRWFRAFLRTEGGAGGWNLQGRQYAIGGAGAYQRLPPVNRLAIRVDGEPVVEIDLQASALRIFLALASAEQPQGDPYVVPERFPREVVKRWVVNTLGNGRPNRKWPRSETAEIAQHNNAAVGAAVLARYPALMRPGVVVPATLGTDAERAKLATHYLSGVEARALTEALTALRVEHGVVGLPVHDSLIVPRRAEEAAVGALRDAFGAIPGRRAVPLKVNRWDGSVEAM